MIEKKSMTAVINLMDDRKKVYRLAPEEAVVAAYEEFEHGVSVGAEHIDPHRHPEFKEYRRGFACGDWVTLKDPTGYPELSVSRV